MNFKMLSNNKREHSKKESSFLFYGLLLYTAIYYSQIGARIPALGKIRFELIIGVIILLVAIPELLKKITHDDEEKIILYPIYFFFAAALISIPTTVAGYHTLDSLIIFFKSFAIFIMIYAGVNTKRELRGFVYILLIMHGVIIIEPFFLSLSGSGFRDYGSGFLRLRASTGLFAHPNALGGLSAGILPVIYFLFRYEKSWIKKLMLVAFGLITLKVITLTESRSALVGAMAFIFFVWITSKKKLLVAIALSIALVIGWSLLDTTTKRRYSSILDAGKVVSGQEIRREPGDRVVPGSMHARWVLITDGLRLFLQRPITGFGIGGFQVARIERLGRYQVSHNAYVQCLAELGIVGFIAWSVILINTFRLLGKARNRAVEPEKTDDFRFIYQMSYAFQGYLSVHLVLSMFGHTPYDNYWWIAGGLSLVLIFIVSQKLNLVIYEREKGKVSQNDGYMRGALP